MTRSLATCRGARLGCVRILHKAPLGARGILLEEHRLEQLHNITNGLT
jgi:hypothetical protein